MRRALVSPGRLVLIICLAGMTLGLACRLAPGRAANNVSFSISFPAGLSAEPLDGRLLLLISSDPRNEPRFQINDGPSTQLVFGIDVDGLRPGQEAVVDASALGYPLDSIARIPPGTYQVQALLHKYETFHRADGHVVKLPMDRGEGQKWNRAPGNLYSTPKSLAFEPATGMQVKIELDKVIPPIPDPPETDYIKHVRIQSELLTKFWGRPMHLGAHVLLPWGFEEHPKARYPLVIHHGHFPYTFGSDTNPHFVQGFRAEPPDLSAVEPDFVERFNWKGYNHTQLQQAHEFYKEWTGPGYPRMLLIEIQHANPYYDDSYAVNSANLGPYGDAINQELIPFIEEKFRGLGQGWARFTYGGSTGGWEAIGVQVLYPDFYNGCFAACPDPIDFRAYTVVDIYHDKNAYFLEGPWRKTPRPGRRNYLGHVSGTLEEANRRELVLGSKGRSGGQWDIWQAVYSPVGDDGYPKPIWDKRTGVIDPEVAAYWRENYDIGHILRRDWDKGLGKKLQGKIHIYVGDMDNVYLNNAVYLVEEFLKTTKNPHYDGEVDYGDRFEHCWNGDHTRPNAISRLRYNQMFAPKIVDRILKSAPRGSDLKSWRY
jgi:hypothetical protein